MVTTRYSNQQRLKSKQNPCQIQPSENFGNLAPNDAWQNLKSHYRAKGTREILHLSHEVDGKTMQTGKDRFQFMMKIDRLAANLHTLGERSVTELKKVLIIVVGLSADCKIEV